MTTQWGGQSFSGFTLPEDWDRKEGLDKIIWFNENSITPEQIKAADPTVTDKVIDSWRQYMGYTAGLTPAPQFQYDPSVGDMVLVNPPAPAPAPTAAPAPAPSITLDPLFNYGPEQYYYDADRVEPQSSAGLLDVLPAASATATAPVGVNHQDIIAQSLSAGFQPYAGNPAQMQALVNGLEVTPYLETVGQTEQDPGTAQQVGYTISTPLGGTNYRTDVVDMSGNLLRSNVHDAGADKYGLGDMAKLAAVALGANALGSALGQPSMFSPGGVLSSSPALTGVDAAMADLAASGGLTGSSMAAAAPSLLSSAPMTTTLGTPLAELTAASALPGSGAAMTAGGLLTGAGAPAALSTDAISAGLISGGSSTLGGASTLGGVTPAATDAVQQIVINGSGLKSVVGPGLLTSAVVPGVLAATAALNTLTGGNTSGTSNTTGTSNYSNEGVNPTDRGNMGGSGTNTVPTVNVQPGPLDGLKAWAVANPELARLLFSGAGALLNTAGGGGGNGGGGYVDSGYRPTISRGGFNAAPQARQMAPTMGLLSTPTTGQQMSGLWRYGLLGG